jgi:phytoene desaturase
MKAIVIGAGFSGLSAATHLASSGWEVVLLEKNKGLGGRARKFDAQGFMFDMGPSWYWMPDVFDEYFAEFGKKTSDYYELIRLNPSYVIYFEDGDKMEIPADRDALFRMFEKYEPGSSSNLEKFLEEAAYKYETGMKDFVGRPGHSIFEFADIRVFISLFRLQMFQSISSHVRKLFKHPKLIKLLEFPVLFLGATPQKTPALYSLMNHADLSLGTWYPMGGMHKIIEGMVALAVEKGVDIKTDEEVKHLEVRDGRIIGVVTQNGSFESDVVIASADYHHVEQKLLSSAHRQYSAKYWESRTMAPSSLLFYLGIEGKIEGLHHHNLFFDEDFERHAIEIYEKPSWPKNPLFYVCAPSVTDATVAPEGKENLFILIPLAPGLKDDRQMHAHYFELVMGRLERHLGQPVRNRIIYKRSYAMDDFKKDYFAFKGNAYGLANTLMQTAFLKPKIKSNKLSNLYYTGQLTAPGPGMPPSLISGGMVAREIIKKFDKYG